MAGEPQMCMLYVTKWLDYYVLFHFYILMSSCHCVIVCLLSLHTHLKSLISCLVLVLVLYGVDIRRCQEIICNLLNKTMEDYLLLVGDGALCHAPTNNR